MRQRATGMTAAAVAAASVILLVLLATWYAWPLAERRLEERHRATTHALQEAERHDTQTVIPPILADAAKT